MSNWRYGLIFDNAHRFIEWLKTIRISSKITGTHLHHTWKPDHSSFTWTNHKTLQDGMRIYHMGKGWRDIAQHVTVFPDGKIMTGRDIHHSPASATGYNGTDQAHPFMIEMVGNFDKGHDVLQGPQLHSTVILCRYFGNVMFHREGLINGKSPKSCPGTGIDKEWFMNLVEGEKQKMNQEDANKIIRYLSASWHIIQGNKDAEKEFNRLANELRKASGQEPQ